MPVEGISIKDWKGKVWKATNVLNALECEIVLTKVMSDCDICAGEEFAMVPGLADCDVCGALPTFPEPVGGTGFVASTDSVTIIASEN